jgi:hypothetical protein
LGPTVAWRSKICREIQGGGVVGCPGR